MWLYHHQSNQPKLLHTECRTWNTSNKKESTEYRIQNDRGTLWWWQWWSSKTQTKPTYYIKNAEHWKDQTEKTAQNAAFKMIGGTLWWWSSKTLTVVTFSLHRNFPTCKKEVEAQIETFKSLSRKRHKQKTINTFRHIGDSTQMQYRIKGIESSHFRLSVSTKSFIFLCETSLDFLSAVPNIFFALFCIFAKHLRPFFEIIGRKEPYNHTS